MIKLPEYGENYYYLNIFGNICMNNWSDSPEDQMLYETNNFFRKKKEAEFASEKFNVINLLRRYANTHNEEIMWHDPNQNKYYIECFRSKNQKSYLIISDTCFFEDVGNVYFSSKRIVEDAILEIGEDKILAYVFGVEV